MLLVKLVIGMPVLRGPECNNCLISINTCSIINFNCKLDDQWFVSDRLNVAL